MSDSTTHLLVSELFTSVQGEGPSLGSPRNFLRLGGCNLDCRWCDTPHTWDFSRFDRQQELSLRAISELAAQLASTPQPGLVVTGGEPLLQQPALIQLLGALQKELWIEVETNATRAVLPALLARVDQWNVSPKLPSSGVAAERAWVPEVLLTLRQTRRAFLKLVIADDADLAVADEWVGRLHWPIDKVIAMPQGTDVESLQRGGRWLVPHCLQRRWRFSPRLQVELWGTQRER